MGRKIEIHHPAKKGTPKTHLDTSSSTMPLKYTKNENGDFVCPHPGCGFTKPNQSTMHYHMKKHEEQLSYVCKECKKGFLQKQTLDLHMRSKHPEKDSFSGDKKFKCPFDGCDFSALTKGNCVIHCLRVHFQDEINEMMYKDNETKMIYCNECDKEFSSSCAFYYHCKTCMDFKKTEQKYQTLQEIIA